MRKCSTSGPSDSAGKNVKAPMTITVPIKSPTKRAPCVGKVPLEEGTLFLTAKLPAIARVGIMNANRPSTIAKPKVRLYQGVFGLSPAKALPLFSEVLEYAYKSSLKPWGPELPRLAIAGPGGFQ